MPTTSKPRCLSLTQSELDGIYSDRELLRLFEARMEQLEAAMDKVLKK